jgi:predicted aspartyl protease
MSTFGRSSATPAARASSCAILAVAVAVAVAVAAALCAGGAQAGCRYQKVGSVPVTWKDQRFLVAGAINGTPVDMIVDSGATAVTLSHDFAEKLGLGLWPITAGGGRWETAGRGGSTEYWRTRVDEISFGKVQWKGAHLAVYGEASGKGEAPRVLVGAGFLFQRDLEFTSDALTFFEPSGCDDVPLAYWADDVPWTKMEATTADDLRVVVTVEVDGRPVRALVDSGAPLSEIDLPIAQALGFDPARAAAGHLGGIGTHTARSWPASFQSFAIGDEVIRHPRLLVTDMYGAISQDYQSVGTEKRVTDSPHMILGADFLRAHRVLFATSQRRMYFSYLGGAVFMAPADPPPAPVAVEAASAAAR